MRGDDTIFHPPALRPPDAAPRPPFPRQPIPPCPAVSVRAHPPRPPILHDSPLEGTLAQGAPPAPKAFAARVDDAHTGRLIACFGPWLKAGGSLYCIDGGNVFDPYALTAWLRQQALAPEPALQRVFVSRAYTCHQLAGAIETLLEPLVARRPAPPALILGIERMFLDENLPLFERRHLFERILREANALRRRGLPLLIAFAAGPDGPGAPWARALERSAQILPDARAAARRLGWERTNPPQKKNAATIGQAVQPGPFPCDPSHPWSIAFSASKIRQESTIRVPGTAEPQLGNMHFHRFWVRVRP